MRKKVMEKQRWSLQRWSLQRSSRSSLSLSRWSRMWARRPRLWRIPPSRDYLGDKNRLRGPEVIIYLLSECQTYLYLRQGRWTWIALQGIFPWITIWVTTGNNLVFMNVLYMNRFIITYITWAVKISFSANFTPLSHQFIISQIV